MLGIIIPMSEVAAQQDFEPTITGLPASHALSLMTEVENNYQVERSLDLLCWKDTGVNLPGTGLRVSHPFESEEERLFYRVRRMADLFGGSFLTLPTEGQELDLIDGVCIAFDLNVLPELPGRIRIYRRVHLGGGPWELMGVVTEFVEAEQDDPMGGPPSLLRFLRGSVVWLPEAEGEYDLQVAVLNQEGFVIGSAVRRVLVGANIPPTITIDAGPASPSSEGVLPVFETSVSDADAGDEIRLVEFFDNGILIGVDTEGPLFGDEIRNVISDDVRDSFLLLRGTHRITARAFDSRGAVGETSSPDLVLEVTGGNARPEMTVTSPTSAVSVVVGDTFTISYSVNDPDGEADLELVRAFEVSTAQETVDTEAPFGDLVVDTTGWGLGSHLVRVEAVDVNGDSSYPIIINVVVRSGVEPTLSESLVADLVDGVTAIPSQERMTGVEHSATFVSSGLLSGLQLDSGVVLTTGAGELWNNGDSSGGTDEDNFVDENGDLIFPNFQEAGDVELEVRVAGGRSFDASSLEFDLFCLNGQLEFEYQFGSEEYDEFVGSFNDAFMITVDGVVVSFVPDCTSFVSVNTVNSGVNEELFLDDDRDIMADPSFLMQKVEYDGLTIKLRGHVLVTPDETHRVRIVIADVIDQQLDSALFIESGSIRTRVPVP